MQLEITDGGGSGGSGTGGTGGTGATGGSGGSGTGAGGGDPGGAGGPACEAHEPRVFACTDIDLPEREDPSGCNLGLAVVSVAPAP
ncbi:hypothetical protein WMF20_07840 [Sorangium sp. So ce834]|uniref:hypothetical protein n=1 Tax=Sorangium sp. So ce834 TaxID=3133321 RepID=UPI003F5DE881